MDNDTEHRRSRIGGSDVAKILNMSPYGGPMDVYLEKCSLVDPAPMTRRMEIGLLVEPTVAMLYTKETGHPLYEVPHLLHPKYQWLGGHIDRIIFDGSWIVELKTVESYQAHKFGEPGTDQIPIEYLLQCSTYMSIQDVSRCDVAVMVGLSDFRIYHLERDLELESLIIEECRRFWFDHVIPRIPPELDGSSGARRYVDSKYPDHSQELLQADPESSRLAQELRSVKRNLSLVQSEKDRLETILKARIGESSGLQGDGWQVTWKKSKSGSRRFLLRFDH